MTREETIRRMLRERIHKISGPVVGYNDTGSSMSLMTLIAVDLALAFADAEAAAMRERVVKEADILADGMDAEARNETDPVTASLHACSASTMRRFSAFVRALPATGEVGRG